MDKTISDQSTLTTIWTSTHWASLTTIYPIGHIGPCTASSTVEDKGMKITAHANGSFSLAMTPEEVTMLGNIKRLVEMFAVSKDKVNGHRVYTFVSFRWMEMAVDACEFVGLKAER